MGRIVNSTPLLYLVMLYPGRFALLGLVDPSWYYAQMMYETGIWSIRFLILSLAVTPCLLLINRLNTGRGLGRWLLQRRRHFGLASFLYAALHLAHYILELASLRTVLREMTDLAIALGWVGLVIFALLALTSNAASARRLGRRWKALHRWVYGAAVVSVLHWYMFDFAPERVIFWAGILLAVKGAHIVLRWLPRDWAMGRRVTPPT